MTISRRNALGLLSAGTAAGLTGGRILPASAQAPRILNVNLLGFSLAIHVPAMAGLFDILPTFPGYGPPKIQRFSSIETLTTTLISGNADIGESDMINALRAIEAGANLKIIGNVYLWSDLVWVVNADKIKSFADLFKPDVTLAANGRGDGTFIELAGALLKRGFDPDKLNVIEVGGSGARFTALMSKRVDGVPMHTDQLAVAQKQGNYKPLLEPWREYKAWSEEVWATPADWLKKPENQRAAVDFMKANITAFRRANRDFDWYVDEYHKVVTLPNAATEPKDTIRPQWQELSQVIKAWPNNNGFSLEWFEQIVPVYVAAKAIKGTVKIDQVIDTTIVQQALKELGRG